jgi:hypothetical protein
MKKLITYSIDGYTAILYPSEKWQGTLQELAIKDVPSNTEWYIIEDSQLPLDETFREAWIIENGLITVDITKAKEVWLNKFRKARNPLLAALDIDFMKAVEINNTSLQNEIASKKQILRDITLIDLPNTTEEIKNIWPEILGQNPLINNLV